MQLFGEYCGLNKKVPNLLKSRLFVSKIVYLFHKALFLIAFCGVGGIRTLVQTRKPSAFYMLSFILIVGKEHD